MVVYAVCMRGTEVYKYFGYSRIVYKLVVLWKGGASFYIMDAC